VSDTAALRQPPSLPVWPTIRDAGRALYLGAGLALARLCHRAVLLGERPALREGGESVPRP